MPSRQRDGDQLIRDAVIVVHSELSHGSKYALLDDVCWTLLELEGKCAGCRYWSRRARPERPGVVVGNGHVSHARCAKGSAAHAATSAGVTSSSRSLVV